MGMPKSVKEDIVRIEPEEETLERFKENLQTMIMKSCRDCYYGCISFDFGIVSCLKMKDLFYPEEANVCLFYNSKSEKETPLWKEIADYFKSNK